MTNLLATEPAATAQLAFTKTTLLAQELEAKGFLSTLGKAAAAVVAVLIGIGLVIGLIIGFFIGRAVGRSRARQDV